MAEVTKPGNPPSVSVWRVCPGAEGNLLYYECYFYTPNIMEYLMARELFMEIGREIMSMEDCIKCYDNGDNTQRSAPIRGTIFGSADAGSDTQYFSISAYFPAIAFPPVLAA